MPSHKSQTPVTIYTTAFCPYCRAAKRLLDEKNIDYEAIDLTVKGNFREFLVELTGQRTVPQILIHGQPIGGFTELQALDQSGTLDEFLSGEPETISP